MWLYALMTSISPPSHLLKINLISVWNGRMPDGGVVATRCRNHSCSIYTNYSKNFLVIISYKYKSNIYSFYFWILKLFQYFTPMNLSCVKLYLDRIVFLYLIFSCCLVLVFFVSSFSFYCHGIPLK